MHRPDTDRSRRVTDDVADPEPVALFEHGVRGKVEHLAGDLDLWSRHDQLGMTRVVEQTDRVRPLPVRAAVGTGDAPNDEAMLVDRRCVVREHVVKAESVAHHAHATSVAAR